MPERTHPRTSPVALSISSHCMAAYWKVTVRAPALNAGAASPLDWKCFIFISYAGMSGQNRLPLPTFITPGMTCKFVSA